MQISRSPTPRLLIGLAGTLLAVALFSWYSLKQVSMLRLLQTDTIDRNRKDSLQLLRIQNDLHTLGLALRDMADKQEGYELQAWRGEFNRIRYDLQDALSRESKLSSRPPEQTKYLAASADQLWRSAEQIFGIAESGDQARAHKMVLNSLQAQQASLSATVSRLLVQNNEMEEQAYGTIEQIYAGVERNIYLFLTGMLAGIAAIGLFIAYSNRRLFEKLSSLSEQRSTLARRLIGVQEEVFRSVSRELHDDFGQILTAIGTMLRRAEKKGLPADSPLREDLAEVREVVQESLEKTRSFSQALHPTVLDDYGLEKAMERYLPAFTKQTGIEVQFDKEGEVTVPDEKAIHIYRVLQEALNNVAKHANATSAKVRMKVRQSALRLEIEDGGVGIHGNAKGGLGMIAMRERAELVGGRLDILRADGGGTLVRLEVPLSQL